jgi:arsenate reductase (glutaredoxin)
LTEKGVEYETVNYFEKPLSAAGLKQLLDQAGIKASEVLRAKEDAYSQHVAGKKLSEDQLLALMAKHPELIQRPIVVRGKKAVLAREIGKLADLNL